MESEKKNLKEKLYGVYLMLGCRGNVESSLVVKKNKIKVKS